MPYIPHTEADTREMLAQLGLSSLDQLFADVPGGLSPPEFEDILPAMTEWQVARLMAERAEQDGGLLNFIGAGAYEHHIPAAVWEIAGRGEFLTAYTPYQPEASQGTLQTLYEFQSMLASLTGMHAANASLYDGASGLAEAVRMALRANRAGCRRVLVPATVSPFYRRVLKALVPEAEWVELAYCTQGGHTVVSSLERLRGTGVAALIIPQPNFFGILEDVHGLTDWVQAEGGLAIGLVNPVSLGILAPPGTWGSKGADIACGEGQPLGAPLSSGGPYFGFICCREEQLRQMPGRIVGRTREMGGAGRTGFVLTLQAREQHIRRGRATSNICTNQGLMAIAAAIHMSLLGPAGVRGIAATCHGQTRSLLQRVTEQGGVERVFDRPYFHEVVLRLPVPVLPLLTAMADQGIAAGYALEQEYPELTHCLLVCATETRSDADVQRYVSLLSEMLASGEMAC